jgi:nucleoside phosphorylase
MTGPTEFYPGTEPSLVTPSAAMDAGRRPSVRPVVVVTFHRAMYTLLRTLSPPLSGRKQSLGGGIVCSPVGRRYTLLLCPVGASGTVLALENAIELGARTIVFLGWCGSLSPGCPMAHVVVPTSAVREEGTSYHYLAPERRPEASSHLTSSIVARLDDDGIPHRTGTVWSTDAPYRETGTKVKRYAAAGVLAVDMETSAILALAEYHQLEAAGALIVSDELSGGAWNPGWRKHPAFKRRLVALSRSILRCCNHLPSREDILSNRKSKIENRKSQ